MLKHWIGSAALAAALVVASPVAAEADFDQVPCANLDGQLTGVTPLGPGVLAVEGRVGPRTTDPASCRTTARLTAYAGGANAEGDWYTTEETGSAAIDPQDGQFSGGLRTAPGTFAVCLEDSTGTPLDCYGVTVPGSADAPRGPAGMPSVTGRIRRHQGPMPSPPPCGHCM